MVKKHLQTLFWVKLIAKKSAILTCLYGPIYLELDDYPPYSDKKLDIFDTHINIKFIRIHGYTNCVAQNDLITWVFKNSWEFLLSEFSQSKKIISFPGTIICNNCEQVIVLGDIFNAGDNVEDK